MSESPVTSPSDAVHARLRDVVATRYVTPLREGGSLPGLVEADDLGTYVVKFTGAGQGRKALVADVVVTELARHLGFRVPELVRIDVDPRLPPAEPDEEVSDLLRASAGSNLGVDFLPGSFGFAPGADEVDPDLAADILWFDAFTLNVDRSWHNPNLLRWHGELWLIDHGAALYVAHDWARAGAAVERPYAHASAHVLLADAASVDAAGQRSLARLDEDAIRAAVDLVPEEWLEPEGDLADVAAVRAAYVEVLTRRLAARPVWEPALEEARRG